MPTEQIINNTDTNGLTITFILNLDKKSKRNAYIMVNYFYTNLGCGGHEYICTYTNDTWNITNGSTSWDS